MSHGLKFDISVPDEGPNETLIFICLNISSVKKNMIDICDVQRICKNAIFLGYHLNGEKSEISLYKFIFIIFGSY